MSEVYLQMLDEPDILPTGAGRRVVFSTSGKYMAIGHADSNIVSLYEVKGGIFYKISVSLEGLPTTGYGYGVGFSPDETYFVVGHSVSPYMSIYKRNGDTFTKIANPTTLPTGTVYGVAFSPDMVHMSVSHENSPYITIYKRDGDTFTKLANPTTLPTGTGHNVVFSSDGTYMFVGHSNSPFFTIYKRSGDTFTKLANPSNLPTNAGYDGSFSSDRTYLAVATNASPNIIIYKRNGDTFSKLADPGVLPTSSGRSVSFSSDDKYVAVGLASSPFIAVYERDGDTFVKLDNPSTLPTGTGNGISFSPDGKIVVIAHSTSPFVSIYKLTFSFVAQKKVLLSLEDGTYSSIIDKGYTANLIPAMTSTTTPSGTVSQSSYVTGNQGWNAFNDVTTTYWRPSGVSPWWISYEFGEVKDVARYTITSHTNASYTPKDWTFEGWDGVNWAVLDKRTEVTTWAAGDKKTFDLSDNASFSRYRINVSSPNGGALDIRKIEFMGKNPNAYKKIKTATEQDFIDHGMDTVIPIDIGQWFEAVEFLNSKNDSLGSGKTFTHTLDLERYKGKKIEL